jgi:hypothetical protein
MNLQLDPLLHAHAAAAFGWAWLALALALAAHVADEALTDFLSVYNPAVLRIRRLLPWLPIPTFTFGVWFSGLAAGVALMFSVSPAAFHASRWIVIAAVPLSVVMIGNGLGHLGASLYKRCLMPGVYSSPFLIAASLLALIFALRLL